MKNKSVKEILEEAIEDVVFYVVRSVQSEDCVDIEGGINIDELAAKLKKACRK